MANEFTFESGGQTYHASYVVSGDSVHITVEGHGTREKGIGNSRPEDVALMHARLMVADFRSPAGGGETD